jgi:hypothetical protein
LNMVVVQGIIMRLTYERDRGRGKWGA